ncbi:NmrA-domain-containing protein [Aureobasidium sp. EXF-3400]|nr:NmrA-domain-containing protein [Aureobasidium sp. EXF-12344]KAI4770239.1 NmrA-domain-containing protein [Aureobasidium sp. EXF-3400]
MPTRTVVTINSTGRQTASFVRVASAAGWHIKAQVRSREDLVAKELAALPNVEIIEGDLCQAKDGLLPFLRSLFEDAKLAFINTTHWGDEVTIGCACASAAKKAGVTHYIYSSMPDHSVLDLNWKPLPLWAQKFTIENYVRQLEIPATFVYAGIYHNNFTSLAYPLFHMELQSDGSFVWQAPFHPHDPLPWLDAEHDVGPALLQIFKMGPNAWKGQRVTLAFEKFTPLQACMKFSRGVGRPVHFVRGPIEIEVSVPSGYREHLEILQETLGDKRAPYFGSLRYPQEARSLWGGYRRLEEYAREVFPNEEAANGRKWMDEEPLGFAGYPESNGDGDDDGDIEEERGTGRNTDPVTPSWTPDNRTPSDDPTVDADDFFFFGIG